MSSDSVYDHSPVINVHETRVRAHQTDLNGAMYHGAYFDIFDDARIETFRYLGVTWEDCVAGGWNPVIRRAECEYFIPARMDQLLTVTVSVTRMTQATLAIRYDCRHSEELLAVGRVVFAFVDRAGKPVRVPGGLREAVHERPDLLASATER